MSNSTVIREDENGDLFIAVMNEFDGGNHCVLDAVESGVWDEYVRACEALGKARIKVLNTLRLPHRSEIRKVTTP
jgi:hypothetical protein